MPENESNVEKIEKLHKYLSKFLQEEGSIGDAASAMALVFHDIIIAGIEAHKDSALFVCHLLDHINDAAAEELEKHYDPEEIKEIWEASRALMK